MDEVNRLVIQHLDTLRVPDHVILQVRQELENREHGPRYAALQESPRESTLMRMVPNSSRTFPWPIARASVDIPKLDTFAINQSPRTLWAPFGGYGSGGVQFTPSSSGSTTESSRKSTAPKGDVIWHRIVRRARKYCGVPETETHDDVDRDNGAGAVGSRDLADAKGYADIDLGDDGDDTSDLAADGPDDEIYASFPRIRQASEPPKKSQRGQRSQNYESFPQRVALPRRVHKQGYTSLAEASPMDGRWSPLHGQDEGSPRGPQFDSPHGSRPRRCWRPLQVFTVWLRSAGSCILDPFECSSCYVFWRSRRNVRSARAEVPQDWSIPNVSATKARHFKYEDLDSVRASMNLLSAQHFSLDVGSNASDYATGESDAEDRFSIDIEHHRHSSSEHTDVPELRRLPQSGVAVAEALQGHPTRRHLQSMQFSRDAMPGLAETPSFSSCLDTDDSEALSRSSKQQVKPQTSSTDPKELEFAALNCERLPYPSYRPLPLQLVTLPSHQDEAHGRAGKAHSDFQDNLFPARCEARRLTDPLPQSSTTSLDQRPQMVDAHGAFPSAEPAGADAHAAFPSAEPAESTLVTAGAEHQSAQPAGPPAIAGIAGAVVASQAVYHSAGPKSSPRRVQQVESADAGAGAPYEEADYTIPRLISGSHETSFFEGLTPRARVIEYNIADERSEEPFDRVDSGPPLKDFRPPLKDSSIGRVTNLVQQFEKGARTMTPDLDSQPCMHELID